MKIFYPIFPVCLLLLLQYAIGENTPTNDATAANTSLIVRFDNVAGNEDLKLESVSYTNASGESFTVSQLQYFISNIRLGRKDGTEYVVPQDSSYFLVQENLPATQNISLNVPEGDYQRISFILGVDSVRNTVHINKRTGVLDPASSMDNGMYWGWNSGYIFFKMEGESAAAPEDPSGRQKFRYHIGGFGGYSAPTINNIKMINLDLSKGIVQARSGRQPTIHLRADILKTFSGESPISIAEHPSVMFSEFSVKVANNYSKMFTHYRTQN